MSSQPKLKKDYIPFKVLYDMQERKQKYKRAISDICNRPENKDKDIVLIILEPHPKSKPSVPILNNHSIAYLKQKLVQKKNMLNSDASTGLFLYVDKTILIGNQSIGSVRDQYLDLDGFLYINYSQMGVY